MPGINVVAGIGGELEDAVARANRSLEACCPWEDYRQELLRTGSQLWIGAARYPEYPIDIFETDRLQVMVDGRIYGQPVEAIHQQVGDLAAALLDGQAGVDTRLRDWLRRTDGEFVVVAIDKATGRLVCFNDLVWRLPLYISCEGGMLVLSRNIRFAVDMLPEKRLDRMGVAQFFLFDFAMGRRTYFEGLERVEGASVITVDPATGTMDRRVVDRLNFEDKPLAGHSIEDNGRRIAELFGKACRERVPEGYKAVVSLSGGMDSRAVAGALKAEGLDVVTASWLDFRGAARADVRIAERVAETLGVPWSLGHLRRAEGRDILRTLQIKLGQVYLGTSHLLQHLDRVCGLYGPKMIYFSGNGGDRVNHDLRPHLPVPDLDALVDHILKYERRLSGRGDLPLEDIAAITELTPEAIKEEIKRELAAYPETGMEQKFVHFILHGQSLKRHHEGDDRNRTHFWSTTPFWSVPVFLSLMGCPDEQKRQGRLYLAYLDCIDPRLARIQRVINQNPNPCWIEVRTPWWARSAALVRQVAQQVWRGVKKVYKPIRWRLLGRTVVNRDFSHGADLLKCLHELVEAPAVQERLNAPALRRVLENAHVYNASSMALLLTVLGMIEYVYTGTSRLQAYAEASLDSYV